MKHEGLTDYNINELWADEVSSMNNNVVIKLAETLTETPLPYNTPIRIDLSDTPATTITKTRKNKKSFDDTSNLKVGENTVPTAASNAAASIYNPEVQYNSKSIRQEIRNSIKK